MIIKFDVESDLYQQIENLVKEGKYQDIIQFIKIAISNQLQEEKSDEIIEYPINRLSTTLERNQTTPENSLKELEEIKKSLENFQFEKSEINREYDDLIWNFYNRLFPVKIAIYQLAKMLTEKKWADLEEWKEISVKVAQNWYKILREYELENEIKMNERLTIGLPTHEFELKKLKKKNEIIKMQKKIESSKNRFMNQFVGRYNKKTETFEGACFSMGFISGKLIGVNCFVSLTELGKQFALLENPIITNKKFNQVFSNDEVKLIYNKIIPQFKTESQIIKEVINGLKKKTMTSDEIQEIFTEYKKLILGYYSYEPEKLDIDKKKDKIIQARVATMGRLSELKIVDWQVISSVSHYSLNQEKAKLLSL